MAPLDCGVMEPAKAQEGEWLRAHRAGDAQAFARLYDRYDGPCFQFIRRTLGPAHVAAAEDVHQETWIAVSRNAGAFDPSKASFAAWLFAIARNKVFDHLRRQKVVMLAPAGDEETEAVPDPGPTPLEQVEARELASRLTTAVEALPLEQRITFLMFSLAGLSLQEIADTTGVLQETVKSRLRYARTSLRKALADERSAHV